jgi:hypothetical protein
MDFRYIADQINQQSGIPLGTGVRQRGMEGVSNEPFVWSSTLQKFVPNPNQFDRLSPADQAQYLFSQTNQFGSSSSDAPVSQRITPTVPFDVNTVNVQDIQQNNAPNASDNVDYQPIQTDNRSDLQPSLLAKLFKPDLAAQFPNQQSAPQSQPNASRQNMAQDNSPSFMQNILGTVPSYYGGLLGAEEAKALQSRANTQGLLGAAIGLLGGMGTRGTTAAQNIAGALGGGLQASQGAIQQGITNYGQQQQLMLQQRQQAGIAAMKIKYPDLADEFDTNPAGAFRIISEREAAANKPTVVSQGGTLVGRDGKVLYTSPAAGKEQTKILSLDEMNSFGLPTKDGQKYQMDGKGAISLISGTGATSNKKTVVVGDYLVDNETGKIIFKAASGNKQESLYSKPVADANGRMVYMPVKPGYPILDLEGKPVTDFAGAISPKPLPPVIQKAEEEDFTSGTAAINLANDANKYLSSITQGQIKFGRLDKLSIAARNVAGSNDPDVVARNDFERFKTTLVNESLRLNKGTQTEGDAVRAAKELEGAESAADAGKAIQTLRDLNARRANDYQSAIIRRRKNAKFGDPEVSLDIPKFLPYVFTEADYARLPKGSDYIDPKGLRKVKP